MSERETKPRVFPVKTVAITGILLLLLLAVMVLWHGNATSNQAMPALVAQVYFDGEYRIADGPWQQIVAGEHISSTEGDVTLRGNFHMLTPDGEYVGIYDGDWSVTPPDVFSGTDEEVYTFTFEKAPQSPSTGDTIPVGLCGILMLSSAAMAVLILLKRKRRSN